MSEAAPGGAGMHREPEKSHLERPDHTAGFLRLSMWLAWASFPNGDQSFFCPGSLVSYRASGFTQHTKEEAFRLLKHSQELAQWHFQNVPMVKASHKASPDSRGGFTQGHDCQEA